MSYSVRQSKMRSVAAPVTSGFKRPSSVGPQLEKSVIEPSSVLAAPWCGTRPRSVSRAPFGLLGLVHQPGEVSRRRELIGTELNPIGPGGCCVSHRRKAE